MEAPKPPKPPDDPDSPRKKATDERFSTNKSSNMLSYSAGFYDGVEQQSSKTIDMLTRLLSDDIPAYIQELIKESFDGETQTKIRQLINTQTIIDLLQSVQDQIESHCFICGESSNVNWLDSTKRERPICQSCHNKVKMQFPEKFA